MNNENVIENGAAQEPQDEKIDTGPGAPRTPPYSHTTTAPTGAKPLQAIANHC